MANTLPRARYDWILVLSVGKFYSKTRLESTWSSEKGLDLKEVDFDLTLEFDWTLDFDLTLNFDSEL